MRPVVSAFAAVLALGVAAPSHAALTCPMLTSPAGTGFGTLDIVSADIASGRRTVAVVLRLRSTGDDPLLVTGAQWSVTWAIDGVTYSVQGRRPAGSAHRFVSSFSHGPVASFAVSPTSFTWTLSRRDMPVLAKPRRVFSGLSATASSLAVADSASTRQTYVDRSKGCIRAA